LPRLYSRPRSHNRTAARTANQRNAEVDLYPAMNAEDLGKGLTAAMDAVRKYA
jgi:hypothetical protein